VKIANSTLSAICHAVDVLRPDDSSELHGKPVRLTVEVEERNDKPGAYTNRVKEYSKTNGAAQKTTTKTDSKTPPWKKK